MAKPREFKVKESVSELPALVQTFLTLAAQKVAQMTTWKM